MTQFDIEAYVNYSGELRVGIRERPVLSYRYILSRNEAEKLVADLTLALSSSDRQVQADSLSRTAHADELASEARDDPWL